MTEYEVYSYEAFRKKYRDDIRNVAGVTLNALIHRDYSFHTEGMPIQLIMYSDRMEIINPGGLYGRLRRLIFSNDLAPAVPGVPVLPDSVASQNTKSAVFTYIVPLPH